MSGPLRKKLFNVWLHITDRYWAARQPGSSHDERLINPAGWRPVSLRPTYLGIIACIMLAMLVTLEAVRQYSDHAGGLVLLHDTDDVTNSQSFVYNYVPVIIALGLTTLWSFVDFDVLRLEPYFQLSRPEGCPANVLFINYNFGQSFITPIASAKRRHWVVLIVSLVTLLIRIFLPAFQSALLELREVTRISHEPMRTWPTLVDLTSQAQWIAAQENSEGANYDAYFTASDDIQQSRSSKYAVAPVQIPTDDSRESTVWTLNQTIYWTDLACDDVLIDVIFPVIVNESSANLSWNVSGVELPGLDGSCVVDFSYDNVFFPDTNFLQVRYWEPTSTDAEFTSAGATKSFTPSGCDQFDLFGVLLSINASTFGSASFASMGTTLNSSATLFACTIQYYQTEAEITMHANSSITNTKVFHETRMALTETTFNIDAFQSLLGHRALYTSDMLFIEVNETTGDRTITELPVINQNIGDLDPVLVLDTSKPMTLDEFNSKVTRGVKQSFILIMNRLFDPNSAPSTVPSFRTTRQVAIAVVSVVVRSSEAILVIGILLTLALLRYYHNRPNILQSDPGSIGAMCSMVTDVFGPTNILAEPLTDFHQFSTRQLRRLLSNCRLQWFYGPLGRRLELVTVDGSPVILNDQMRIRGDPMPHFLVIPIFLVEFLLLAAVIVVMSLIISRLARDGGFQDLTQSDSSFLQVVLSFLPSVVASVVAALCTSIHRNLSILEPWVHLQRGMATASRSITMNYSCQNPWSVLPKAAKKRHVLLGVVSFTCIANTGLTLVAGGIFTQQLTTSHISTDSLLANYSHTVFRQNDFAADFTEYDLIQTSITSGVPLLPWTGANHSFAPIGMLDPDPNTLYSAVTLGVGSDLDCEVLSIPESLQSLGGSQYWVYSPFGNASRECTVKMTTPSNAKDKYALSINFLSPVAIEDLDECQTSTVMILGRWNYTSASQITHENTVALHCEPEVQLKNFSITFDQRGQIQTHNPIPGTEITSGQMYENATVSLGQFNKVFASIPQSFFGEEIAFNTTFISSYDWAGFLVAQLYKRDASHITHLDPERLMDLSQTVYQWVYSTYFSLWREIYLQRLQHPPVAENATLISSTWCMVPSVGSLIIGISIIALDTVVVLLVFGTRRGRFNGPRIPRSIGSVMPWIANSRMIDDFRGTYGWTNAQRQTHLEKLGKRYGFRSLLGEDNQWRYGVDEEPPDKTTMMLSESGAAVAAKPQNDVELNVIENPGNIPDRTREPGS